MSIRSLVTMIATGAVATAIALALPAGAGAETLECDSASATACPKSGQGSTISVANGDSSADSANWPFRAGNTQPVWVLE